LTPRPIMIAIVPPKQVLSRLVALSASCFAIFALQCQKSHTSGGAMLKSGVIITQTPQITGFVGYVYDPAGAIGSRP
jgi:hypothetical protein